MAAFRRLVLLLPLLVLLLVDLDPANAVQDRCAACRTVALELDRALENEKPRNDLDLRHRLDSKGQRQGKVIQYKFSELRVLELLEDLCTKVKDYTLSKSSGQWIRFNDSGKRSEFEKQEHEVHSKEISSYCGRLLERHEDELASAIRNGEVVPGSVDGVLCEKISMDCESSTEETKEL